MVMRQAVATKEPARVRWLGRKPLHDEPFCRTEFGADNRRIAKRRNCTTPNSPTRSSAARDGEACWTHCPRTSRAGFENRAHKARASRQCVGEFPAVTSQSGPSVQAGNVCHPPLRFRSTGGAISDSLPAAMRHRRKWRNRDARALYIFGWKLAFVRSRLTTPVW